MLKELIKIANELDKRGLTEQANALDKLASKATAKAAKGINWSVAERALSDSGVEPSRDDIISQMMAEPAFSIENIEEIHNLEPEHDFGMEEDFVKRLNKKELIFLELGGWLKGHNNSVSQIKDYLIAEKDLKKPGDLLNIINVDLTSPSSIAEEFEKLNKAQEKWHKEAGEKSGEDKYLTHEVVHDFGDGWVVVYVPAVGEGPNYKGNKSKSNDRTVEGNICGLCLGEKQGLYQTNESGKIYSVRNPNNEPKVTIRIQKSGPSYMGGYGGFSLAEAKGKNNLSPAVPGARRAKEWFDSFNDAGDKTELNYKNNYDYRKFPPVTIGAAKKAYEKAAEPTAGRGIILPFSRREPWTKGWIVHWYKKGISEIDKDIEKAVSENDSMIFRSGFAKKYKELAEPVVKHWARPSLIAEGHPEHIFVGRSQRDFEHEVWKTYRKSDWMQEAVDTLFRKDLDRALSLGLHLYPEYKEFGRAGVENGLDNKGSLLMTRFYDAKLDKAYPDLGKRLAETFIDTKPYEFFEKNLEEKYPELKEKAAFACAAIDISKHLEREAAALKPGLGTHSDHRDVSSGFRFFKSNLHIRGSAEAGKELAKVIVADRPAASFEALTAAPNVYQPAYDDPDHPQRSSLIDIYPDLADIELVTKIASLNPEIFFNQYFDKKLEYKHLALDAAKSLLSKRPGRYFLSSESKEDDGLEPGRKVAERPDIFLDYYNELEPFAVKRLMEAGSEGLFFEAVQKGRTWPAKYMRDHGDEVVKALLQRADPNRIRLDGGGDPRKIEDEGRDLSERGKKAMFYLDHKIAFEYFNDYILGYRSNSIERDSTGAWVQKGEDAAFISEKDRERYREYGSKIVEQWAVKYPEGYFQEKLGLKYPQFKELAIKSLLFHRISGPINIDNLDKDAVKDALDIYGEIDVLPPEVERILKATAEIYPELYLDAELYEIYPELKESAIYALAEKNPKLFFDKNYDIEFPELRGAASAAASARYNEHAELPEESPIDYREIPMGEEIEDIDEADYFNAEYEENWDPDDPDKFVISGYNRKLANLKIWLIKNHHTSEARRLMRIIGGAKNG